MNKNKILTIVLSIFGLIVLGVVAYFATQSFTPNYDGKIVVELVSLEEEVIKTKEISFNEGDTLVSLVEDNFENVLIKDGMIMNIEDYQTPSDWSTFLSIYVNGEMSMVGISEIKFEDGTLISFKITEFKAYE